MSSENDVYENARQRMMIGMNMCRGVVQRYMAYVQGVDPLTLFESIADTNTIDFANKSQTNKWSLKFDIVDDKFYIFDAAKCPCGQLLDILRTMQEYLCTTYQSILHTEIDMTKLPRPELFKDSGIRFSPIATAFIYNKDHGAELHDAFTKRIAFVWVELPENTSEPEPCITCGRVDGLCNCSE